MEGHALLVLALGSAVAAWLTVASLTLVGRIGYDRRQALRERVPDAIGARARRRLVRRATSHRTESGKWRRVSALQALARVGDDRAPGLLRAALASGDPDLAGAAVRALAEIGTAWAVAQLVDALRRGLWSRSRIATQLDALLPQAAHALAELLDDPDPQVRYWAVTLLGPSPDLALEHVIARAADEDANVRAAAVESLAERGGASALVAVRDRLEDDAWFVRVHACRAIGQLGELDAAPLVAAQLRDSRWWVRTAAKDALRSIGIASAGVLVAYLDDDDAFARNCAAEVLQDIGFVDALSRYGREGKLRERILVAGGDGFRAAFSERDRLRAETPSALEAAAS